MKAIIGKKRGKGSGRMLGVVVGEFCQWEEAGPVGLLVVCIDAEVLFQHGLQPLRLPVCKAAPKQECLAYNKHNYTHLRIEEKERMMCKRHELIRALEKTLLKCLSTKG